MLGMMMNVPLSIPAILEYAGRFHGANEIVSRAEEGGIHRTTYGEALRRTRKLSNALLTLGFEAGDRIGTLAWNGYRHLELYYAVPGCGLVCHTINPRLFPEQIDFIVNDAEDRCIFVDLSFVTLLEGCLLYTSRRG